jgi:hypothetical protein
MEFIVPLDVLTWLHTSGTRPLTAHQAPQHKQQQQRFVHAKPSGKPKENKSRHFKKKPQKPNNNHAYEGLLSMMQSMLRRLDSLDMARRPPPKIK